MNKKLAFCNVLINSVQVCMKLTTIIYWVLSQDKLQHPQFPWIQLPLITECLTKYTCNANQCIFSKLLFLLDKTQTFQPTEEFLLTYPSELCHTAYLQAHANGSDCIHLSFNPWSHLVGLLSKLPTNHLIVYRETLRKIASSNEQTLLNFLTEASGKMSSTCWEG
jgi:hypothetical protein